MGMNTTRGLRQLYERFGVGEFSGEPLRAVMIEVSGAGPNPGWQAAIHLSRLVRSKHVDLVREVTPAKAKWAHVYQLTAKALKHLRVDDPADGSADDPGEELDTGRLERIMAHKRHVIGASDGKRVKLKDHWLTNDERQLALKFAIEDGFVQVTVTVQATDEGLEWLAEQAEEEGKA